MDNLGVAFSGDFVLGHSGSAARTPRHDVFAFVKPAVVVASLEERPDRVVVLIGFGVVRVIPLHEVAETLGLACDDVGEMVDAGFALFNKLADTVCLDFLLGFEAFFLFYFNLDPQTLAVVAILKPLAVTLHVPEAEEEVFVSSSPRMVDAHQVVCSDRAVDEGVVFLGVVVARQVAIDESSTVCTGRVPTFEPLLFSRDEVDFGFR